MLSRLSIGLFFIILCSPLLFLEVHAGEGDTYSFSWLDPEKKVYVLQNRKYRKKGNFHINMGAGITTSGAFVDSKTFQGRAGYFFREEWGFELIYAKNSGKENSTANSLRNNGRTGSRPFRRIVDGYQGVMVLWSPFYSKINTFNSIIYVDWILGAGYSKLEETNNKEEFITGRDGQALTTETHTGVMWDTALKFYINQQFDLRLDLTVVHFKADVAKASGAPEETWYSNWDASVSLGYNF